MYGDRGRFEDETGPTCKQCTRVDCLEVGLDEVQSNFVSVTKTLKLVLERKLEGIIRQEKEGVVAVDGISKSMKDSDKGAQEQKEQKQEKAVTNQRKDRMLLVGDSLVRNVGRNLQQQCAGLNTVCKPGGRMEQMVPEIEKRDEKRRRLLCKSVQIICAWMRLRR